MQVTVKGVITSIVRKEKVADNEIKVSTELLLAQQGEKEQVAVRLPGDQLEDWKSYLYQPAEFFGRLMTWKTRDGIGSMVMVEADV